MPKGYTKDELWKLYDKLPQELQEAIFDNENADNILKICNRYGIIEQNDVSDVAVIAGQVLLGLLPPTEFQGALEKELKLRQEVAKDVSREIFRYIFYPVKANLEELYKIEVAPVAGGKTAPAAPKVASSEGKAAPETKVVPSKEDTYREPPE